MLKTVLLEEEYCQIPEHLVPKIDKVLNDASEQYLNLSALFETFKRDQGSIFISTKIFVLLVIHYYT